MTGDDATVDCAASAFIHSLLVESYLAHVRAPEGNGNPGAALSSNVEHKNGRIVIFGERTTVDRPPELPLHLDRFVV
jgi:hypothetical protein